MPAFPFQGWMPDGYRSMPLPVLVFFSGVVSKVAAYGFLRVVLPIFPDAAVNFQTPLMILALISILYGSAQAFTQTNTRLILGYSSLAQLGFITLGIFSLTPQGAQGAILQMVNHGLVVAPLFLIIVLLAERAAGLEDLRDMGGLALRAPVLAGLFLISRWRRWPSPARELRREFLILLGTFESKRAVAIIATIGVAHGVGLHAAHVHRHHAQPRRRRAPSRGRSAARGAGHRAAGALRSSPSACIRSARSSSPRRPCSRHPPRTDQRRHSRRHRVRFAYGRRRHVGHWDHQP
jgi:NADH:ubiquinone oxidoreductase subunit 4 (subunit M)